MRSASTDARSPIATMMARKRAVVFDLFHTLTAVETTWGGGRKMTFEMLGVSRDAWEQQLQRKSRDRLVGAKKDPFDIVADMARDINPAISDERIRAATENRIARFASALMDIPEENLRVIASLKAAGKRIGLLSNADTMEAAAWNRCKAAALFDSVVFSCAVGFAKPDAAIYGISLRELGVAPAEAVFVGDGGSDELAGARSCGITPVMVTGIMRHLWPERIAERAQQADFVIERLPELIGESAPSE